MSDKVFVDTNVLIDAHDVDAGEKRQVARRVLAELWNSRLGVLSSQVLQELYVNVTRKISSPLTCHKAREIVRNYGVWQVVSIAPADILQASELEERHQISFWDALIVVAARNAGAVKVLSEDLSHGHRIGGVMIENPFAVATG